MCIIKKLKKLDLKYVSLLKYQLKSSIIEEPPHQSQNTVTNENIQKIFSDEINSSRNILKAIKDLENIGLKVVPISGFYNVASIKVQNEYNEPLKFKYNELWDIPTEHAKNYQLAVEQLLKRISGKKMIATPTPLEEKIYFVPNFSF